MDRDKAEELWGKCTANANRMQANELGFEKLANYLSKYLRGKKRWSQSKNIARLMIISIQIKNYMSYHKTKGKEKSLRSFIQGLFILDMMLYLMMLMEGPMFI